MENILKQIYESVVNGDASSVEELVQQALKAGIAPEAILNEGLIAAMQRVGKLFEEGEFFVPEMLVAARAMQAGLNVLRPILSEKDIQPIGKIVIGTVKGDLHDIGKNLVAMMLEGAGFQVIDLGIDVPPQKFIEAIQEHQPQIVAMSALLTTTIGNMRLTIDEITKAGLRERVKVMVGGAPVTEGYARQIGADGYAPDAGRAATLARQLVGAEP
ncbi:MAG: corrinoid protein [Anaerolineales bacterium]|nr:corrinoid protein [Anaerolineales bacterium]MCS7248175.1 corrinoid protein [Anaerolineales bacterium]MDW8161987.1 corrinoid protein [Anaerolineales bacterium]MDW8446785.1 corrinoid protein [Anaerolineales bacterium]